MKNKLSVRFLPLIFDLFILTDDLNLDPGKSYTYITKYYILGQRLKSRERD
jgi:hypothetical protein